MSSKSLIISLSFFRLGYPLSEEYVLTIRKVVKRRVSSELIPCTPGNGLIDPFLADIGGLGSTVIDS